MSIIIAISKNEHETVLGSDSRSVKGNGRINGASNVWKYENTPYLCLGVEGDDRIVNILKYNYKFRDMVYKLYKEDDIDKESLINIFLPTFMKTLKDYGYDVEGIKGGYYTGCDLIIAYKGYLYHIDECANIRETCRVIVGNGAELAEGYLDCLKHHSMSIEDKIEEAIEYISKKNAFVNDDVYISSTANI